MATSGPRWDGEGLGLSELEGCCAVMVDKRRRS